MLDVQVRFFESKYKMFELSKMSKDNTHTSERMLLHDWCICTLNVGENTWNVAVLPEQIVNGSHTVNRFTSPNK